MNRGNARQSAGDARGAIPDYDEAIRLANQVLEQLMPHPPVYCIEVWVKARRARAALCEALGDAPGATADRAAVDAWLAKLTGQAEVLANPGEAPSPLTAGPDG